MRVLCLGFWSSGLRGLGSRLWSSGLGVEGLGFWVQVFGI